MMKLDETLLAEKGLLGGKALIGALDGVDEAGRVHFRPDGSDEAVAVILGLAESDEEVIRAALTEQRALVMRTTGEPGQLVLVGLLREGVSAPENGTEEMTLSPLTQPEEAVIDGKVVRFEAREEIVLQCGKGSITLRKRGKIIIKGTHLLSRATGVNRIKGGQVNIN